MVAAFVWGKLSCSGELGQDFVEHDVVDAFDAGAVQPAITFTRADERNDGAGGGLLDGLFEGIPFVEQGAGVTDKRHGLARVEWAAEQALGVINLTVGLVFQLQGEHGQVGVGASQLLVNGQDDFTFGTLDVDFHLKTALQGGVE